MINQQIQNYKITSLLGEGGMATVYLAEHVLLHQKVAVKILKTKYVNHQSIRKRFLAEARSLAQLNHTNIIKVTDLIDTFDIVAFVMEYFEGETLENYIIRKGNLTNNEIKILFGQMIIAVKYIHNQKLIHRDIKPSNFLVGKDKTVKLLDFGIAKNLNVTINDFTRTTVGQQMGSPLYMSPEQVINTSEITKYTDYYSLGIVLWQMVMRKKPYDSFDLTLPEIQVSIIKDPLPLTLTKWDSIIQNATDKNPETRSIDLHFEQDNDYESTVFIDSYEYKNAVNSDIIKPKNNRNLIIGFSFFLFIGLILFWIYNISEIKEKEFVENNKEFNFKDKKSSIDSSNLDIEKIDNFDSIPIKKHEKDLGEPDLFQTNKKPLELKVGQKHLGGIIAYLDDTGEHGLVCAENDVSSSKFIETYEWDEAQIICNELILNGYISWSLPSLEDLKKMYKNRYIIGGFQSSSSSWSGYWSRSESDKNNVWTLFFENGEIKKLAKNNITTASYIRPVHKF